MFQFAFTLSKEAGSEPIRVTQMIHDINRVDEDFTTPLPSEQDRPLNELTYFANQLFHLFIYHNPQMMLQLLSVASGRPLPDLATAH